MRKNRLYFFGLAVLMISITGPAFSNQLFDNVRAENGEMLWLSAAVVDVLTSSGQTVNVTIFDCANRVLASGNINVPAGVPGRTVVAFLGPIPSALLPQQSLRWRFLVGTVERGDRSETFTNGRFAGDCTASATAAVAETPINLEGLEIKYWIVDSESSSSGPTLNSIVANARPEEGNYVWYGATIADRLTTDAFVLSVQVENCQGEVGTVLTGVIEAGDFPPVAFLIGLVDGGRFMPLVWNWFAGEDSGTAITDDDGTSPGVCP